MCFARDQVRYIVFSFGLECEYTKFWGNRIKLVLCRPLKKKKKSLKEYPITNKKMFVSKKSECYTSNSVPFTDIRNNLILLLELKEMIISG